mmetsp:Transcript_1840/g.6515  ORF Transcript_1840/g.6515 Transcript_1840/m.6515 type:complete len:828 (-) Transcript_1840:1056-3539(-)
MDNEMGITHHNTHSKMPSYIYFQTPSHLILFLSSKPKQQTLTDSHLIIHATNTPPLVLDFFEKIDFANVKVEMAALDFKNEKEMASLEFYNENGAMVENLSEHSIIKNHGIKPIYQITIPKEKVGMWPRIEIEHKLSDRDALIQRRQEAMQRRSEWEKQQREALRTQKLQEERRLFDKQWDMEKERRGTIEEQKQTEREEMRQDIGKFAEEVEVADGTTQQASPTKPEITRRPPTKVVDNEIFNDEDIQKDSKPKPKSAKPSAKAKKFFEKLGDLYPDAPVRHSATPVKISFTPRVLRSAARQDKDAELLHKFEIWKRKNRPEKIEDNPAWIKQRGDKFFAREDYLAAINAYTAALEIDPDFLLCYANRAACHLNRKEYVECIQDCNRFLITRPDETSGASTHSREKIIRAMIKVFARRGSAYYHIGEPQKALRDYEMAIQMDNRQDQQLIADFERMKQEIDSTGEESRDAPHHRKLTIKSEADAAFQESRFADAIDLYTQAINMNQEEFTCRSNRAACLLKIGNLDKCVTDCNFIIDNIFAMENAKKMSEELEQEGGEEGRESADQTQSPMTHAKKTSLILKAYVRRGTCYSLMGNFQEGYADYTAASRIVPNDESLLHDMEKINKRLQSQIHADWFKNRGNFFFSQEEYETAIRSYDLAIKADDTNPVYFANRAQCYMKLKQYFKCIRDIDAAFNTRIPDWFLKKHAEEIKKKGGEEKVTEVDAIPANPYLTPALQLKLFMRRATCFKYLDDIKYAYSDFRNAARLSPNDKVVKDELRELEPLYNEIVKKEQEEHLRKQQAEQEVKDQPNEKRLMAKVEEKTSDL